MRGKGREEREGKGRREKEGEGLEKEKRREGGEGGN